MTILPKGNYDLNAVINDDILRVRRCVCVFVRNEAVRCGLGGR